MLTDIEIAQSVTPMPVEDIAAGLGLSRGELVMYGSDKAKVRLSALKDRQDRPDGKLVLVTAITPTPAGEGKTTTTVGLGDALHRLGKKTVLALREPSLGPVFGIKGGAAGGGYAQVIPMEDINLHFTGDMHAIGAANNLLAAMLDNHIHQGNALGIDTRRITWKRCVDMNDRQLRQITDGLGGRLNGVPREDGFDITVASEIMAILCLARDIPDLKEKLAAIVVGYTRDEQPVTAGQLKAQGVIRAIGLSSHNPEVALEAVNSGAIEVLMFSVNPCYDLQPAGEDVEQLWNEKNYQQPLVNMDPQRQALYETCQRLGVGITVMKAFGGGDLLNAELSPAGRALTLYQCLHYALTRPAVASVMSGARTLEELKTSIAYEEAPEAERDYAAALAALPRISWVGHCMYCGHCAPCPAGIDVANVTKFLNLARAQGEVPETVREHYAVLPHHGGECLACGACEKRCPFGVPVIENMRRAAEVFGA